MNAEEARRITRQNLQGPVIEKHISNLDTEILRLAAQGKSEFDPKQYLHKLRTPAPKGAEWEAISTNYRLRGFNWTEHPDPDPGHPASHSYTILSW